MISPFTGRRSRIAFRSAFALLAAISVPGVSAAELPKEPLRIGREPQFVFDRPVIDNQWALKYKQQSLARVFHAPRKSEHNPVIAGRGGMCNVRREADGTFRMWYQLDERTADGKYGNHAIAYAQSRDGIHWTLPNLGLVKHSGAPEGNVVWAGVDGEEARGSFLLDLPEADRKGFRYVMLYRSKKGLSLVGSSDGVRWDPASVQPIYKLHSDTHNILLHDPARGEYVVYCRPKHVYRTFQGDVLDTGESRRIARMTSRDLWTNWAAEPQTILVPDELDEREHFNCFYGMPTARYGGLYWGLLWCFKMNSDIHTELAFSRDGISFDRLPDRPKLIERGPEGSWDDGMVFGEASWVEVGDEWWIYYAGWDGPHNMPPGQTREVGVGLATIRKEGFISMRGPAGGGVLVTRQIEWPGGELVVNADAAEGELSVRVTDARRKPLAGFDYADCTPLKTSDVAHRVAWRGGSLADHAGRIIRLEFLLKSADLYTFRASEGSPGPNATKN